VQNSGMGFDCRGRRTNVNARCQIQKDSGGFNLTPVQRIPAGGTRSWSVTSI
jgi:hypothetical protein